MIDDVARELITLERLARWQSGLREALVVPSIVIAMTVSGPHDGTPHLFVEGLPDDIVVATLRRIADQVEQQSAAPFN